MAPTHTYTHSRPRICEKGRNREVYPHGLVVLADRPSLVMYFLLSKVASQVSAVINGAGEFTRTEFVFTNRPSLATRA